jgi:serine/threonine-protein kinase
MGDPANGLSPSAPGLSLPRTLGSRILLKLAARGGMGDVYLAATTGIDGAERPCIVKTVRRDHIRDNSFLARFSDEARVQAQLHHPGVAQVLDASTDENGEPYTVVEYVEGRSLGEVRQRATQAGVKVDWPAVIAIGLEIAQALAHVHGRSAADGSPLGIVHRDLSPQNVMVGYGGEVKLIDFGTARAHNRRCHTVTGVVFAKPGYIAPEVARQEVGDGRIDLYALGVILWELCTGRKIVVSDPMRHLDDAAAGRLVLPPAARFCDAPELLDAILTKLTHNDPVARYVDAAHVATALAELLASAPPVPPAERGVRARIASLMAALWPNEPSASRAEFARLLSESRKLLEVRALAGVTPVVAPVSVSSRSPGMDSRCLEGTPYRLLRPVGGGASSVVWEGEHTELGQRVAIKMLVAEHAKSPIAVERFRREARVLASLSHPQVVRVLDFGTAGDGRAFLAMEFCEGETLDVRAARGALPWRQATRLAIEAADALASVHDAGFVHCDFKPQNVIVTETGQVKLLDFGVARVSPDAARRSTGDREAPRGFSIIGTPQYMAPEQASGDAVDARADVYALGCVLYELLTGTCPFDGASPVIVLGKHLREAPVPPRICAPRCGIPISVDAIVMRALEKEAAQRFPTIGAMRDALRQVLAVPERRRNRAVHVAGWAAMLLAGIGLAHGAASLSSRWGREEAAALDRFAGRAASPVAVAPASGVMATPALEPAPAASVPSAVAPDSTIASSELPPLHEAKSTARAHPTDPRALELWVRAALRAGDLREARRAASAWALHDGRFEPRLYVARVLEASGRRSEARDAMAEWLESHPDAEGARAEYDRLSGDPGAHSVARR